MVLVMVALTWAICFTYVNISFAQDVNEPDVSSAVFTSDGGYFDFTGLSLNDTVGASVNMIAGGQIPAHNITTTLLVVCTFYIITLGVMFLWKVMFKHS